MPRANHHVAPGKGQRRPLIGVRIAQDSQLLLRIRRPLHAKEDFRPQRLSPVARVLTGDRDVTHGHAGIKQITAFAAELKRLAERRLMVRDDKRLAGQIAGVHRRNGHRAFHADSALSARDVADLCRRVRAERLAHLQALRQLKFLPEQRIRLSAGDGSAQGNLLRSDFRAARRIHPCEHLQRLRGRAAGIQLHNRAHIQPPALHRGIHMLHPRLCLYATFRLRARQIALVDKVRRCLHHMHLIRRALRVEDVENHLAGERRAVSPTFGTVHHRHPARVQDVRFLPQAAGQRNFAFHHRL